MKTEIHPQYHTDAKVTCACGNIWTIGSTAAEIRVELCSKCHPFYTGEQRIVDTEGRVERLMRRFNLGSVEDAAKLAQETAERSAAAEAEAEAAVEAEREAARAATQASRLAGDAPPTADDTAAATDAPAEASAESTDSKNKDAETDEK